MEKQRDELLLAIAMGLALLLRSAMPASAYKEIKLLDNQSALFAGMVSAHQYSEPGK